jgi:hypothetical protein
MPDTEEMSPVPMPPIKSLRVGTQRPFHPYCQIGLQRLYDQMKMIAHQAIRMHLPSGLLTSLSQGLHKLNPIRIIIKDCLAASAPAHHMVMRSSILIRTGLGIAAITTATLSEVNSKL